MVSTTKAKSPGWQRKIDGALVALRRQELHLGNKVGFWSSPVYAWLRENLLGKAPVLDDAPKMHELQHRRLRILSRYR